MKRGDRCTFKTNLKDKAMGAPVNTGIENFEEVILGLSKADRVKLLGWIAESLVEEENSPPPEEDGESDEASPKEDIEWPPKNLRIAENPSGKTPWYEGIPSPKDLSEEERQEVGKQLFGAWKDTTPDDFADQIMAARTVSGREINLDE